MSVSSFSLGIMPASESLSAFTITINRIVLCVLPNFCCFHWLVERASPGSTSARIILRAPLLTRGLLTRQPFYFHKRPNLDCAVARRRNSLGDRHRFVQVVCLNDVVTAE